jgi:hypothetical protein
MKIKQAGYHTCGSPIVKDWGGVQPQYHCIGCGEVLTHAGRWPEHTTDETLSAVIHVFNALNKRKIRIDLLLQTTKMCIGYSPVLTEKLLLDHGFKITGKRVRYISR